MEKNRQIFDFVLKVFLFLSSLFLFKDYLPSFARSLFFICGTFVLYGVSLSCEPRRKFSNIWVSLFFLLAFIPIFFNTGEFEFFDFWGSMYGFLYILCGIILFKTVYCHSGDVVKYIKPILAVCVLNLILVSCQMFGYDFLWRSTSPFNPICGFFESPSQLGQYSAMSIPILFCLSPILAIIPLLTLILSKSVTPMVALFIGSLFYAFYSGKKKIILLIVPVIVIASIFCHSYIAMKWYTRPIMWKQTLHAALQKPFIGHGYQSFNHVVIGNVDRAGGIVNATAFNDYFQTALELGFPILIVVGMFLIGMFKKFKNKDILTVCLATSIVIVLVNMFGQSLIRHASISGTFIVLLALFYARIEDKLQKE